MRSQSDGHVRAEAAMASACGDGAHAGPSRAVELGERFVQTLRRAAARTGGVGCDAHRLARVWRTAFDGGRVLVLTADGASSATRCTLAGAGRVDDVGLDARSAEPASAIGAWRRERALTTALPEPRSASRTPSSPAAVLGAAGAARVLVVGERHERVSAGPMLARSEAVRGAVLDGAGARPSLEVLWPPGTALPRP